MKENQDEYSIIVDNVYKTFNVYKRKIIIFVFKK